MTIPRDTLGRRALDFCETVRSFDSAPRIRMAIDKELKALGFDYVSCGVLPGPTQAPGPDLLIMNTRPAAYSAHYHERNYAPVDPALTELQHTVRPFSWSDVRTIRKPPKHLIRIVDEAADFGMTDGLTIPIYSTLGTVAVFCPAGNKPDLHPRVRAAVEIVGIAGYQALRRAAIETDRSVKRRPSLSPREREVMHWIAAGKSNDEIALIIGVSTSTVSMHLTNAMLKLGATKRTHAVVEAIRRGEVEL